jgi:hypothetical protein
MKKILFTTVTILAILLLNETAMSAMKKFSWSPVTGSDVIGYKLYIGHSSRNYTDVIDVGNITRWAISLSDYQPSYLAVTAYNSKGESVDFSAELIVNPSSEIISRFPVDLNHDSWQDILYIKNDGVYGAIAEGSTGHIGNEFFITDKFSPARGWNTTKHIVTVKDLNNDGYPDIVGFGGPGVAVAYSIDGYTFEDAIWVIEAKFCYQKGWLVERHPRGLVDINNDGYLDIYGFGGPGVAVAYSIDGRLFQDTKWITYSFGYRDGWLTEKHPRGFIDINNDGYLDIYGFGDTEVTAAYSIDGHNFEDVTLIIKDRFCYDKGWRTERHPRGFIDINNDGYLDIYGFGGPGVAVAHSIDGRLFYDANWVTHSFGYGDGWLTSDYRTFLSVDNDDLLEIVGWSEEDYNIISYSIDGYSFISPTNL